jgi:hypothetical protein
VQKVLIQLELPTNLCSEDLANQVADCLIDTLGARVVTMKVSTEHETLIL